MIEVSIKLLQIVLSSVFGVSEDRECLLDRCLPIFYFFDHRTGQPSRRVDGGDVSLSIRVRESGPVTEAQMVTG